MEAQLQVLARRLPAARLTDAAAEELEGALRAISCRLRELAGQGSCEVQAAELAQLLRGLAAHSHPAAGLAARYIATLQTVPPAPQALQLAVVVAALADASSGIVQGVEALEEQQQWPFAWLDQLTVVGLLHWLPTVLLGQAAYIRQALLFGDARKSAQAAHLRRMAILARQCMQHIASRAGNELYSAALLHVQRSVPLLLACLVPGLGTGAEPGPPIFGPEQWMLAEQGPWVPNPPEGDDQSAEERCWMTSVIVLGARVLSLHVRNALTGGPATLQLQRSLAAMLHRLRQQLHTDDAAEVLCEHRTALGTALGTLVVLLHCRMVSLDALPESRLCRTSSAQHGVQEQAPPPQQVQQVCLGATLSCFQAAAAVPDVAAALQRLVALGTEASTSDRLSRLGAFSRWQRGQCHILAALAYDRMPQNPRIRAKR
ncbi:hypothetical protein ABPG75_005529 [Micractinium tetrahymenae]